MVHSSPDPGATLLHWNRLADKYDAAKQRNDTYYTALKRGFDEFIPLPLRGRVLDFGCGTGQILASLDPREGVGIDVSGRMIDLARERLRENPRLRFEVMSATDAHALGESVFDAVISADMLEHVGDWPAALAAMVAACRPGGVIVIATPNPMWAIPLWTLEKLRLKMPEGPHRFVSARRIAEGLATLDCQVMMSQTRLLCPIRLWGLGSVASEMAARLPVTRRCGVIQFVVARRVL